MPGSLPYLRLLRAGTLFSPAGDVIAGRCIAAMSTAAAVWDLELARAAAASVLLYGAGMVWNDIADRGEDARQRPERPLPRGDLSLPAAIAFGSLLLGLGLLVSPCRSHHGVIAALVLFYDFVAKRNAVTGAITMGGLRALNLVTAAGALTGMPAPLLAAALCYGGYIVAVTVLGTFEDTPSVRPRAVVAVQTAPPLLACTGLLAVQGGPWPAPALALLPILVFARRNRSIATWDRAAIRSSMLHLLLGTMLYTALLCLAAGRLDAAIAVAAGIPAARAVTRWLRQRTLT